MSSAPCSSCGPIQPQPQSLPAPHPGCLCSQFCATWCRTAALLGASGRDPLEQLSYGERLELQAALNRKRQELAVDLLRAGVGARMVRICRQVSWRLSFSLASRASGHGDGTDWKVFCAEASSPAAGRGGQDRGGPDRQREKDLGDAGHYGPHAYDLHHHPSGKSRLRERGRCQIKWMQCCDTWSKAEVLAGSCSRQIHRAWSSADQEDER